MSTEDQAALDAFYAEHYPDWTVHALPLMVYVPLASGDDVQEALALIREILDDASFDIRALVMTPAPPDLEYGSSTSTDGGCDSTIRPGETS